jgi:hypothetical protein
MDADIHFNIPRTAYGGESTELSVTDRTLASAVVHAVHNALLDPNRHAEVAWA